MSRWCLRFTVFLCLVLVLAGCAAPKTPLEVTQAFWEAVVRGDAEAIVRHSTLTDASQNDRFVRDWRDRQLAWGQIVITGHTAKVESRASGTENSVDDDRRFYTHLVDRGDGWRVDYARTADAARADPLAQWLGSLDRIGEAISDEWSASTEELNAEMQRLSERFEEYADVIGTQTSESIEKLGEVLRRRIHDLAESIERTLKEFQQQLSTEDRRTLTEVANDLKLSGDALAEPSAAAIADGSRQIGLATRRLRATDEEILGDYQEKWRDVGRQLEADIRGLLERLAEPVERRDGAVAL